MKRELWKNDPSAWRALPLSTRLNTLRKEYCNGIFGSAVDMRREALNHALCEAVNILKALEETTRT